MPSPGENYFFISSLAKGIKVLEILSEKDALTVSDVARQLGANRASSHRFLATLRELGYVQQVQDKRYRLTFKLFEMGFRFANRFEIREVARPYLQELSLAFNETVNLGYLDGLDVLHIDKIDGREILRVDSPLGSRAPVYCTALGKAMLSVMPQDELHNLLDRLVLKKQGPNTITSIKILIKELDKTRKRGFAVDDCEMAAGLRCIAAPVYDHTGRASHAISVSGPALRITNERLEEIHPVVRRVGRELSEKLGYSVFKNEA
ncbi:MAG: IclR family transcriptional regulator [Thermodesulfobacteriota bacterium]